METAVPQCKTVAMEKAVPQWHKELLPWKHLYPHYVKNSCYGNSCLLSGINFSAVQTTNNSTMIDDEILNVRKVHSDKQIP